MREGRYFTMHCYTHQGWFSIVQASTGFSQQREGAWLLSTIPTLLNTLLFSLTGHHCECLQYATVLLLLLFFFLTYFYTSHNFSITQYLFSSYYLNQLLLFTYYLLNYFGDLRNAPRTIVYLITIIIQHTLFIIINLLLNHYII